jgi:hypothetical protein
MHWNVKSLGSNIIEVRGQFVILDFVIAGLFGVQTKRLNEQVKRNGERFPADFMFTLTQEEWGSMWSQFATTSQSKRKKDDLPYAFTEFGVAMLSSVLRSPEAIELNIAIVRTFIALRKTILSPTGSREDIIKTIRELSERIDEHDTQLKAIYDTIEGLLDGQAGSKSWEERERIGFRSG